MTSEEMYNFENSVLEKMENVGMTRGEAKSFVRNLERRISENEMAIENAKPFALYSQKKN